MESTKIKLSFLFCFLLILQLKAQNPYVGKWQLYDIQLFNKKDSLSSSEIKSYSSTITFFKDHTFEKIAMGDTLKGKYEYTANKLIFLEKNSEGEYKPGWTIRWPKKSNDPMPRTPLIDICYPELINVHGILSEWDFYYIKVSEQ